GRGGSSHGRARCRAQRGSAGDIQATRAGHRTGPEVSVGERVHRLRHSSRNPGRSCTDASGRRGSGDREVRRPAPPGSTGLLAARCSRAHDPGSQEDYVTAFSAPQCPAPFATGVQSSAVAEPSHRAWRPVAPTALQPPSDRTAPMSACRRRTPARRDGRRIFTSIRLYWTVEGREMGYGARARPRSADVPSVAAAADVSPGRVQHYFTDRARLVQACFDAVQDRARSRVEATLAKVEPSPAEVVAAILRTMIPRSPEDFRDLRVV